MKYFYGTEDYLINRELRKIMKSSDAEVVTYDEISKVDDIIMELTTHSLFSDEKIIVLKNISAFSNKEDGALLVSILEKDIDGVEVIFINNVDKRTKSNLDTFLGENAEMKEFKHLATKDVSSTIIDITNSKGGTISNGAAIALANKLPNDLRIIIAEIEKLLQESMEISQTMIDLSISDYAITDNFAFSNAVASLDAAEIMDTYRKKIDGGEKPETLIAQMASIFTLANKVHTYKEVGMTSNEIAAETKIHIFRIKKANELLNKLSSVSIQEIIMKLTKLETDIKTGFIDSKVGLSNFLVNLIK